MEGWQQEPSKDKRGHSEVWRCAGVRRGRKKVRGLAILAVMVLTESFMCLGTAFGDPGEVTRVWDFEDGDQGWVYDDSWAGDSYQGEGSCEYDEE